MLHRIFIAVNISDEVKDEFLLLQEKWTLPIKWTERDNFHITLSFLGNRGAKEIEEIKRIAKKAADGHSSFQLEFVKATYGPKESLPSMVWVKEVGSKELKALQKDLEKELMTSEVLKYAPERKSFSPHITLGRLQMFDFRNLELEERPQINDDFSFLSEVRSLEIMESKLSKEGSRYTVLESVKLTEK